LGAPQAVLALPSRMTCRSSAATLVAPARRTHRLMPANGRAASCAIHLPSVALATEAHRHPALAAVEQPKGFEYRPHTPPARCAGQRSARQA
jgi:hypothetical protein